MIAPGLPLQLLGLLALTTVALAATVWAWLRTRQSRIHERVEELLHTAERTAPVNVIADDAPTRGWERLLIWLGRHQADGVTESRSLRTLLVHAGIRRPSAIPLVLGVRALLTFGVPIAVAPLLLAGAEVHALVAVPAVIALLALGHLLPTFVVAHLAALRRRNITAGLPDVLDLIVLCVESGLSLNAAIARVAEERADTRDALGQELAQLANELTMGVPRRDALRNLASRTGNEDLRALVGHLVQSERLGGSIAGALRAQADSARAARKLRAEEIANRMPVKMLLPTLCFMPALFLVIFVPVALHALAVFSGGKTP
jgi:tight adherence protein C